MARKIFETLRALLTFLYIKINLKVFQLEDFLLMR